MLVSGVSAHTFEGVDLQIVFVLYRSRKLQPSITKCTHLQLSTEKRFCPVLFSLTLFDTVLFSLTLFDTVLFSLTLFDTVLFSLTLFDTVLIV